MKQMFVIAGGVFLGIAALLIVREIPTWLRYQSDAKDYKVIQSLSREDVIARCGKPLDESLIAGDSINETYAGIDGSIVQVSYEHKEGTGRSPVLFMYISGRPQAAVLDALPCLTSRK